ncbi:hypothetical protein BGX31_001040, partial [Mortierella sp. GBA43]
MNAVSTSARGDLSPQTALKLAKTYLENAHKATNPELTAIFYNEARAALSRMEQPSMETLLSSDSSQDQSLREEITYVLNELDKMMATLRQQDTTQEHQTNVDGLSTPTDTEQTTNVVDTGLIPQHIFAENKRPPAIDFNLPESNERLMNTPQLAYCLGLLLVWRLSPDDILDPAVRQWLRTMDENEDDRYRIMALATDAIGIFVSDGIKDIESTVEAACLVPFVDKAVYRHLLEGLCNEIEQSVVLESRQLQYLAQVIRGASAGYLEASDLIKILVLLQSRLNDIHQESPNGLDELVLSVSRVMDAMADTSVENLDRQQLYQSFSGYVNGLKATSNPYFVYQAASISQALQHVPDDETIWLPTQQRNMKPYLLRDNVKADVKDTLQQIQDRYEGSDANSNMRSQATNGRPLLNWLEEYCDLESKHAWYPTLRMADALLCGGRFIDFKKLVFEAPCRRHPVFQWGLCQLLGDLAANQDWDRKTRLNAVAFLEDMYRNDTVWGQQAGIMELIAAIFTELASLPEGVTQGRNRESTENSTNQALQRTSQRSNPMNSAFPSFATPSLLDRVQDTPGVESRLYKLRKQRLADQHDRVYVGHRAKATLKPQDTVNVSLMDNVKEFLRSEQRVFLLLGSSGSGKSTFSRVLERDLWDTYQRMESPIPLYVDMSTIGHPTDDLIGNHFRRLEFTEVQIKDMMSHRKFILICDEYDHMQPSSNLYTSNKLNQPEGWNAKMIVCCRAEYFESTSMDRFYPADHNSQAQIEHFQQAVIEPFTMDQVHDYIKQYATVHKPLWKADDYLQVFNRTRCLQDMSKSPLLLSLAIEVLPRLMDTQHELATKKLHRVTIYDQIIVRWYERSRALLDRKGSGDTSESSGCGNVTSGIGYLKRLAEAIYKNQGGHPVVEFSDLYSQIKRDGSWKEEFFGQGGAIQLLREASPLKRRGNRYHFVHPSLVEYGLALAVFDTHESKTSVASRPTLSRRGSEDSVMSFESDDTDEGATTVDQGPDHGSPLIWRSFANDIPVLQFLEDRVQQEPLLKRQLMAFIELSKTDKKWRTAAANSITILVGAGISFNGADLQGIQVPGANLSYGSFESAQLQGADLRKVILHNTGLSKADLTQAQMKGVQFGDLPPISVDEGSNDCAYSPDGGYIAVGLDSGGISVYSTSSLERIKTLVGHPSRVNSVAFLTRGTLVSGSSDKTVRVWDIETGICLKVLSGHTNGVSGVAFSRQRDQVVSCSYDRSIRFWDLSSGTCRHTLSGHTDTVWSVMFSPNDRQLASGSGDNTVRLWDVETGMAQSTLSGHDDTVYSIAYSPQGHLIASGSRDMTVRLWNVDSGTCQSVLRGHSGSIRSVTFSPLGGLVASGGTDNSIRLWDVESGICRNILRDHEQPIRTVAFSPKGDHIISGSEDKTVRLWNFGTGDCRHTSNGRDRSVWNISGSPICDLVATADGTVLKLWDLDTGSCVKTLTGHSNVIKSIELSPAGNWVVSGSCDKTARLWDVATGVCLHVLSGHSSHVGGVAFSPEGSRIASGSGDKTIRLWDAVTGQCTQTLVGHTDYIWCVAYSPTFDQIASGSHDKTVRQWDLKTESCIRILTGH